METNSTNSVNTSDTASQTAAPASNPSFFGMLKRHPKRFSVIFGIVIALAALTYQSLSHERDLRFAESKYNESFVSMHTEMLLLLAKPTVWSLRTELLRNNTEQAQFLIDNMIKNGNFVFIHVIDPLGIVIATSDKALLGKPVGVDINEQSLQAEEPICELDGDARLLLSAPVMGVDRKIASLVFAYSIPQAE